MTFSTQQLVGSRTVVRGTDINGAVGEVVLDSAQWEDLKGRDSYEKAKAEFDAAVEAFYAPINQATEALEAEATKIKEADPVTYLVLEEGVEGTPGHRERRVTLTHDSQVLRLLEEGQSDRLVWVGDNLEITVPSQVVASGAAVIGQQNMPAEEPDLGEATGYSEV